MANLTRVESFDDLLGDMFKGFFVHPVGMQSRQGADPQLSIRLDVQENDKAYKVHADIPGVAREDIKVTVDGDLVTISAERSKQKETKEGERVIYSERSHGNASRAFRVNHEVDLDATEAKYENGVLALTLAKKAASNAKRLQIS